MRALLLLYMTAPVAAGGLGFGAAEGGAIYGLYTSMVYMAALPGGWIADRLLGQRRAVLCGRHHHRGRPLQHGDPALATFYLGLSLIVVGTGLLKGNVSVIVGQLYAPQDQRRDAGFSIFYMGINLGAFLAPLVCGYLGQRVSWHTGFARRRRRHAARRHPIRLGARNCSAMRGLHPAPATPAEPRRAWRQARSVGRPVLRRADRASASAAHRRAADHRGRRRRRRRRRACCSHRGVLRLAVLRRRLDAGGAQAPLRDRRAVPRLGALLVGVRAGRVDAEPLRRSQHPHRGLRPAVPEQLVPVASTRSSSSRWRRCSRGSGCGWRRAAGAVQPGQVRVRPGVRRPRLRGPDRAGAHGGSRRRWSARCGSSPPTCSTRSASCR